MMLSDITKDNAVAKARELLAGTTPGPWGPWQHVLDEERIRRDGAFIAEGLRTASVGVEAPYVLRASLTAYVHFGNAADADFIAAAPELVAALVAAYEEVVASHQHTNALYAEAEDREAALEERRDAAVAVLRLHVAGHDQLGQIQKALAELGAMEEAT